MSLTCLVYDVSAIQILEALKDPINADRNGVKCAHAFVYACFRTCIGRRAIDILLIGTGIVITLLSIPFVASKTLREAGRSHS